MAQASAKLLIRQPHPSVFRPNHAILISRQYSSDHRCHAQVSPRTHGRWQHHYHKVSIQKGSPMVVISQHSQKDDTYLPAFSITLQLCASAPPRPTHPLMSPQPFTPIPMHSKGLFSCSRQLCVSYSGRRKKGPVRVPVLAAFRVISHSCYALGTLLRYSPVSIKITPD